MTVTTSAPLDAPIAAVWKIISDFAGLQRWHPAVVRCETEGSGPGAVRTVHFADWWAVERLDRLDERNHMLGYSVVDSSRAAVIGVRGTIALTVVNEQRTRLDWTSGLEPDKPYAAEVNAGLSAYYPARIGHLKHALANLITATGAGLSRSPG